MKTVSPNVRTVKAGKKFSSARRKQFREQEHCHAGMERLKADLEKLSGDESPGDVISADSKGNIVLDDGITTYNPLRACKWLEQRIRELKDQNASLIKSIRKVEHDKPKT